MYRIILFNTVSKSEVTKYTKLKLSLYFNLFYCSFKLRLVIIVTELSDSLFLSFACLQSKVFIILSTTNYLKVSFFL